MKEKRFQTYSHRYGYGNTHRYVYDELNKIWYCLCRNPGLSQYHGREVDDSARVTCKKCNPRGGGGVPPPLP